MVKPISVLAGVSFGASAACNAGSAATPSKPARALILSRERRDFIEDFELCVWGFPFFAEACWQAMISLRGQKFSSPANRLLRKGNKKAAADASHDASAVL